MVPTWLKKFLNGPASFSDLFSSYLAQSSYLVRNRTPSQVGAIKILKGGWAISELLEPCIGTMTLVFVLKVVERRALIRDRKWFSSSCLGIILKSFEKESILMI